MSMFGSKPCLKVADKLDSDGELELSITPYSYRGEGSEVWIDEECALKLIQHLKDMFDIV